MCSRSFDDLIRILPCGSFATSAFTLFLRPCWLFALSGEDPKSLSVAVKGHVFRQSIQGKPSEFRHVILRPDRFVGKVHSKIHVHEGRSLGTILVCEGGDIVLHDALDTKLFTHLPSQSVKGFLTILQKASDDVPESVERVDTPLAEKHPPTLIHGNGPYAGV